MKKSYLLSALCLPFMAVPALADNNDHYNYGRPTTSQSSSTSTSSPSYTMGNDGSFTGPYLGGTIDYSWTQGNGISSTGGVTYKNDASENGIQGGVLGGYGMQFDPGFMRSIWSGYTAFELGYEWNGSDNGHIGPVPVTKGDTMLASIRPGVSWGNKALGYGILGYSRGEFTVGSDKEWLNGYSLGAGTELATYGPMKTRLEYVYTNYASSKFGSGGTTAKYNPHDNAIKLGAVYHF